MDICIFGDSIGKGIILQPLTNRYETIKMNIEKMFGRNDINIQNYAMFGCTVTKGLSVIKRHIGELNRYAMIFLEIGGNDCNFEWKEIAQNPEGEHVPKTSIAEFGELYEQIIQEIRSNQGNPTILTLPPLDPGKFFKWVSRGINADNILKWLGDIGMIYRWQELYNLEVMKIAQKLAVPIIDIRSSFLKCHNYGDLICEDGIHPNLEGHELILRTIAKQY